MRLIPLLLAAATALATLAACGTKTPLTLPPQAQPAAKPATASAQTPAGAPDSSNKAVAEPKQ